MAASSQTVEVKSRGVGFLGLLTVLFIGLKLTGYISWSWLWVLSPVWLPLAALTGVFLIIGVIWLVCAVVEKKKRDRWG